MIIMIPFNRILLIIRKRKTQHLCWGKITMFKHVCSTIANDDMFSCYYFQFKTEIGQNILLPTCLLQVIVDTFTTLQAKRGMAT